MDCDSQEHKLNDLHLLPVRCYTCNRIISRLGLIAIWENGIRNGKNPQKLFEKMKIDPTRFCCRRIFLSSIATIESK